MKRCRKDGKCLAAEGKLRKRDFETEDGETMLRKSKKAAALLFALSFFMSLLAGCGSGGDGMKVVLTTGFRKDEVFRIESVSCTLPEMMVYLTNIQNQYESVYGTEIWNINLGDMTLEQNVKDIALAQIAQIKTMNLMAEKYQVGLTKEEKEQADYLAKVYYASLNETEVEAMGVSQETIENLYREYALANKVYQYIIKDINPEISDDEARTIKVQQILLKTYATGGTGRKIEYTEKAKEDTYKTACEVWDKAMAGEDFDELIRHYNEGEKSTCSFGKGETEPAFEKAAFNLGTNEISEIVETEEGYHIIKCISTFDKEETDSNKVKIVEQRRKEVFGQEYDAFVETLTRKLNEELWESIGFIHDENVRTADFWDVFNNGFAF